MGDSVDGLAKEKLNKEQQITETRLYIVKCIYRHHYLAGFDEEGTKY